MKAKQQRGGGEGVAVLCTPGVQVWGGCYAGGAAVQDGDADAGAGWGDESSSGGGRGSAEARVRVR